MSSAETEGVPGARAGDVLNGKYRVDRVLGVGGMGVVVAATHLQLDEKVAIKFLLPDAAKQKDVVERFDREAKAAVKIKSEHVARVSDVGKLDNGAPYMVMEYLQGKDLAQMIEDHGALPVPAAVEYLLQASEALAEAHALGIVHRDLKPANLFLTQRADGSPCIKVLDFGISKMVNSLSNPGMTKTTAVMGSPLYMSPEQMKSSKDVDHRTDIWSLGAILYELLAGDPPFIADTMPQLCLMILQDPLPALSHVRRDVPPQLEAVVQRAQAKDANHRFQNVAEFAAALTPFVTGRARLSAERIADVLRAAPRTSASSIPTPAPPAGAPAHYGAPGYGPPGPTVAGAPYGVSNPNLPPGAYGQTGGGYVAHAQTNAGFSTSNPSHPPMAVGATVVAGPGMPGFGMPPGATAHGQRPPIGASTASSWEGSMGATKKKSSVGIIVGAIAGVALLAGVGIAFVAFSGPSGDGGAAANTVSLPTGAADGKPTDIGPAVTVAGEVPTATPTAVTTAEPTPLTAVTAAVTSVAASPAKPGPGTKAIKPTPTTSATATAAPKPTSTGKTLEDDRY
jgi:serine/threonine protein kinase